MQRTPLTVRDGLTAIARISLVLFPGRLKQRTSHVRQQLGSVCNGPARALGVALYSQPGECNGPARALGVALYSQPGECNRPARALGLALYSQPDECKSCLLYTSPSPRDRLVSRMPSSA